MNTLKIVGDKTTPKITFNGKKGMLEMSGLAVPEDVRELSSPVMDWLEKYQKEPKPATELTCFFEYVNTAATKFIYQVCDFLNEMHCRDTRVRIVWKYQRGDLEMLDLGEEMIEDFVCLSEIVAVDQLPKT